MELIGYVAALFVGITLGLLGGGGSILTVPIFSYMFLLNPVTATAYSLFVVGVTALIGAIRNIQKGMVDFKIAFLFAVPAFIAVYLTRRYLIPAIPETIIEINQIVLTKDKGIMLVFSLIMLLASFSMIKRKSTVSKKNDGLKLNLPLIVLEGGVVGVLTGIVGAGGGFLIIPALVLFAHMPMKKAVATSLLIIAMKSLIGFLGDIQNLKIDWTFLLSFTAISIVGIFIGIYLNSFIDDKPLKKGFGWFVLIIAIYIIAKELFCKSVFY